MESDGLGFHRRDNTVLTSLEHAYAWKSTTRWKKTHKHRICWWAQQPHTLETQVEVAQPCECVGQDHPRMVKKCTGEKDKRDFETFALDYVKHSVKHRPKIGEKIKTQKKEGSSKTGASGRCTLLATAHLRF